MAYQSSNILSLFNQLGLSKTLDDGDKNKIFRLRDMVIRSVHLVDRGANKRRFLVVKREDGMPGTSHASLLTLGPEIVENPDGTLSVDNEKNEENKKSDENVEKQISLPSAVKAGMLRILTEAQEKGASLMDIVKNASESDDGKVPAELIAGADSVAEMYGSLGERFPAQKSEKDDDAEKEEKEEDEEKKAAKAAEGDEKKQDEEEEEDEMKKLEDGFQIGDQKFTGLTAQLAETVVQKAGRRIAGRNLKRFKSIMVEFEKLLKELDPKSFDFDRAFSGISKRMAEQDESQKKEIESLKAMLQKALAGQGVIGSGAAAAPGDNTPLKKEDPQADDFTFGVDMYPDRK